MSLRPEDYEGIRNLYGRYSIAVDTGDVDAYASCFTDDAVVRYDGLPEHLGRNGDHVGRERMRALVEDVYSGTKGHVMHVQVPQTIHGDGDEARVVVYDHVFRRGQAPYSGIIHTATAEDTVVRQGDRWAYKIRVGHIHNHDSVPTSSDVLVVARDEFVSAALTIAPYAE